MRSTLAILLVACNGSDADGADTGGGDADTDTDSDTDADSDADTDTDPTGQCGEVTTWNLVIIGGVNAVGGQPADAAHVVLKDRVWDPGSILGETTTNGAGLFQLNVYEVTSLELCWGTLGYYIEADKGTQKGDAAANTALHNAIDAAIALGVTPPGTPNIEDDLLSIDLSTIPIQMEESPQ